MKYIFYFDEAFHDRKIVISDQGSINTLREEAIDDYVGVFWGCKREHFTEYDQQLTDFERKYRKVFGLAEDKELKSEIIGKKNYQYGLRSFNKNAQSFYTDLFMMLSQWDIILQINIVSKIELLIREALRSTTFPPFANRNAFIYSLTKLIVVHRPQQLIAAMEAVANRGDARHFRDTLLDTLNAYVDASHGVARKERSTEAFQEMMLIVESMDFKTQFDAKTDFQYHLNFEGVSNLLRELRINTKDVKITIDNEKRTFAAAQEYRFGKLKQRQSDFSIQLRLSDFLSGFVGRMIYALKHDEAAQEKELKDYREIDLEDIKKKRLLNPKWFELKESHFEMYKLLYEVLIVKHEHYWTTLTSAYNDDTICFYSLLRYIASYQTYEQFIAIPTNLHSEYYNSCAVEELADYYVRL